MTPTIDCVRVSVRLEEIRKATRNAQKMLADCNTGREFDQVIRVIELQTQAIRNEIYGY